MKKLLLIGGGHSHVEVIRRFARDRLADVELTLVNPTAHTPYSGMLPGLIAGHYSFRQCHIDLPALAQTAGCRYVRAAINGVQADTRLAFCDNGETLAYDVASIDIGSTPATLGIAGAAHHGLKVKPTDIFLRQWDAILQRAHNATLPDDFRIVMAGGGAAGVEVLLSMRHRLQGCGFSTGQYAVVTDGDDVLTGHGSNVRAYFRELLDKRGVAVHLGQAITEVNGKALVTARGEQIPADLVVWATGAAPAGWPDACDLATDERGFIRVSPSLQVIGRPDIFASGDIASMDGFPRPRSGVYAVRQGPPLAENLRRFLEGNPLQHYHPQPRALALISTGNRYAVASRGWLFARGSWIWRWKDWIDRRFMRRYGVA
ncbi:MAG: FAD-dependent oxidoreductase [Burkholderiales bacterium]|jgi:selenide,water dikinase